MIRRRRSRREGNSGVQLIQIIGLGLVLVMILLFRDEIAGGAGNFLGGFGSEDVQLPEEQQRGSTPDQLTAAPDVGQPSDVDAGVK